LPLSVVVNPIVITGDTVLTPVKNIPVIETRPKSGKLAVCVTDNTQSIKTQCLRMLPSAQTHIICQCQMTMTFHIETK
jgi:hypothetical protein